MALADLPPLRWSLANSQALGLTNPRDLSRVLHVGGVRAPDKWGSSSGGQRRVICAGCRHPCQVGYQVFAPAGVRVIVFYADDGVYLCPGCRRSNRGSTTPGRFTP